MHYAPFILSATSAIQSSFSLRKFLRSYSLHQSFQAASYKNKVGMYNSVDPRHMALLNHLPLFDHISNILTNVKLTELLSHYAALVQSQSSPRLLVPTQLSAASVSGGKRSRCTIVCTLASSWLGHNTLNRKEINILRT